jgi:predicted MPP superfamily phosphohydrolase
MQMAMRVGEWRLSPSMILYKRWSGLYSEAGRYLYINDGIGYAMYPMRIGARPEITLIELKCSK